MKKYTKPSMEVIELNMEGVIMNTSNNTVVVDPETGATSPNAPTRRSTDWTNYEGR